MARCPSDGGPSFWCLRVHTICAHRLTMDAYFDRRLILVVESPRDPHMLGPAERPPGGPSNFRAGTTGYPAHDIVVGSYALFGRL